MSTPPSPCCAAQPDRYVSFKGIDCDGNARRLMDTLLRLRSDDPDEQPLRELFERHHDQEALDLLEQLEEQCF